MPDKRITSLTALSTTPNNNNLIPMVDVADTTMGASGTDKKVLWSTFLNWIATLPSFFAPMGLTGATAASRYVGSTAAGAPTSGTFAVGDYVVDQTGKIWVCVSAGTSGTWVGIYNNGDNPIMATGNAATVPIVQRNYTVTNNSPATLTITITISGAVAGQLVLIRILDATAVAQTITWVNTENSTALAPTASNGSTTLPLTVGFQYNYSTSKWRCIGVA